VRGLTFATVAALALLALAGCMDFGPTGTDNPFQDMECSLPQEDLFSGGVAPDGIPSLQNPEFVAPNVPAAAYLQDDDRVIGFLVEGEAYAVPHNIGWWHEIVNLDFSGGLELAVTYCPLTGSSLTFTRDAALGATFGVSGLLFRNNLILFDRSNPQSLWPQMKREARCGAGDGTPLQMYPSIETTWEGWKELYPETRVVGSEIGMGRDYTRYPYGSYEETADLFFPQSNVDDSRFLKERTLGIPEDDGEGGVVFPFYNLKAGDPGPLAVATAQARGGDAVVFWDETVEGAVAFRPEVDGQALTFTVGDEGFVDDQTGSLWRMDGLAVDGTLAGVRLEPIPEAYVAFWFAWMAFHPEAELWEP